MVTISKNGPTLHWKPWLVRQIVLHSKALFLIFGVIIGSSLGVVFVSLTSDINNQQNPQTDMDPVIRSRNIFQVPNGDKRPEVKYDQRYNTSVYGYPYVSDNSTVANSLKSTIRIVCWVWCSGRDIYNQTVAIRKTWGRKCDKLVIFTDVQFSGLDTVDLIRAGVTYSKSRYIMAYRYVYKHYKDYGDWFFGTFDETYVCMENLRLFLSQKDWREPYYYGHKLYLEDLNLEFVDARVGCVLSKEALIKLGTYGTKLKECNEMEPAGEKQLGACLNNLGVQIGNSTDFKGRTLFLSFPPALQMQGLQSDWFMDQDMEGKRQGVDSISRYAITFSGMTAFFMYGIECYLFHMRPFGLFPREPEIQTIVASDYSKQTSKHQDRLPP